MRHTHRILITLIFASFCVVFWMFLSHRIFSQKSPEIASELPLSTVVSAEPESPKKTTGEDTSLTHLEITPANIIWFSNYYRKQNGLAPLLENTLLKKSAQGKTNHMIKYRYFAHTQPGTSTGFDFFIDEQNYEFIKIGENLAMGDYSTSQELVTAWMNSNSHRKNILDSEYTEIGVHVAMGSIHDKPTLIITQHFGRPKKICPTVNESSKEAIASINKKIEQLGKEINVKEKELQGSGVIPESSFTEYYELVKTYNTFISNLQVIIDEYNVQVKRFDACVRAKR